MNTSKKQTRILNRCKVVVTLLFVALTASCASPKRGDLEFAPGIPPEVFIPNDHADSIYQAGSSWSLFEDIKARHIGDMVIVKLEEQTNAQKKADTATSKTSDVAMQDAILAGLPVTRNGVPILNNSYSSDVGFTGAGDSSQSNKLTGTVAVTVVDVLHNGNLVVQGEKWISINQGQEYVRFKGIIRPTDIDPKNTISSTRVANAQIQYGGDGVVADSSSMGWLTRFFNSSWMPF